MCRDITHSLAALGKMAIPMPIKVLAAIKGRDRRRNGLTWSDKKWAGTRPHSGARHGLSPVAVPDDLQRPDLYAGGRTLARAWREHVRPPDDPPSRRGGHCAVRT